MKDSGRFINWMLILVLIAMVLSGCFSTNVGPGERKGSIGDFPDYDTLSAWVKDHAQPFKSGSGMGAWYTAALAVQREAAADGYLVSAVIVEKPGVEDEYLVWCTALAGGNLYWWHPEESECNLMFTAEALAP